MNDWSSYDTVAERYDDVWGSRFEAVARRIAERVALPRGSSVLDIGCGTGIVLEALGSLAGAARLIGCDKSAAMIRVARRRVQGGRFVEASAERLPFRSSCFDAATASFVISHLEHFAAGLAEAHRVLKPGGVFVMTSWTAAADAHDEAWRALLADLVSEERLRAAVARVAPAEARFERAEGVEAALKAAGFARVAVQPVTVDYEIQLDHFLADREISSGGRFGRHALGPDGWSRFVARAREELGRRFGSVLACSRGVLIGLGTRAG